MNHHPDDYRMAWEYMRMGACRPLMYAEFGLKGRQLRSLQEKMRAAGDLTRVERQHDPRQILLKVCEGVACLHYSAVFAAYSKLLASGSSHRNAMWMAMKHYKRLCDAAVCKEMVTLTTLWTVTELRAQGVLGLMTCVGCHGHFVTYGNVLLHYRCPVCSKKIRLANFKIAGIRYKPKPE